MDSAGNRLSTNTELRYYPYGVARYTAGATPTSFNFTGQRKETSSGLLFYGARWYDPTVGRFLQADTIVPQPGDPQSLNRYAYTLNNPLRYTDPTGMFSEDEIMKYYGVKTWEEVLAIFGKGGKLEGQWGWLETLRQAELGDEVWFNANASLTSPDAEKGVQFKGVFVEDEEGHLRVRDLSAENSQDSQLLDPDDMVRTQSSRSYALFRNDPSGQLTLRLWIGEWQANTQYVYLRSIDWNYMLNPMVLSELAEVWWAPVGTGLLTVAFADLGVSLCTTGVGCIAGAQLGIAAAASGTSTYLLGKAAVLYSKHIWMEAATYGP